MRFIPLIACMAISPVVIAQDAMPPPEDPAWNAPVNEFHVQADSWARPRHGERVASLSPVRRAVRMWMDVPGAAIAVIYPGGEAGRLWGSEIRDWLVALGIPAASVQLRAGSPREDAVVLRVLPDDATR